MTQKYPRDLAGYGAHPPDPQWPNGARIALQVVLNYEEGGENCVLHGDPASESFLSEIIGADARRDVRHLSMESIYEYGSRVGVWRLKRLFETYQVPVTEYRWEARWHNTWNPFAQPYIGYHLAPITSAG